MQQRSISIIARDISTHWAKPYFGAIPYLRAMHSLDTIGDKYGQDDAKGIIVYFLSNATTWRGDKARAIKAELKTIAGIK